MAWRCSRCGKVLTDYIIKITTTFEVFKSAEEGIMVPFSNLSEPTSEMLCAQCFDDYAAVIDLLNRINNGKSAINPTEAVNMLQYGTETSPYDCPSLPEVQVVEDVTYADD